MIKIVFILVFSFTYIFSDSTLSDGKIQGRLNILNGYSAECVMHKFYTNTGWIQIEGEIGRNGIDGLYYKRKNGVIREVLVAESKWNTSRLGYSGKHKLVKQMSKEWILRVLGKLKKYQTHQTYVKIKALVEQGQYRARLFRMKPKGKESFQIVIYKIKNKGEKSFDTFVESKLKPVSIRKPKNTFEIMLVDAYNGCREEALHKYFPMLPSDAVEELKQDNYLKPQDIQHYLYKKFKE